MVLQLREAGGHEEILDWEADLQFLYLQVCQRLSG